jgi:hypothetical protein
MRGAASTAVTAHPRSAARTATAPRPVPTSSQRVPTGASSRSTSPAAKPPKNGMTWS